MAYSNASLDSDYRTWAAADKPMILGKNWLRDVDTDPIWNQTGSWADADESASGYEGNYAYDDHDHVQTYPGSSQTTWYFLMDLDDGTTTDPGIVDAVGILNPHSLGGVQIDVQIANDNAFTTNLITLQTITPTTAGRVMFLDLDHTSTNEQQYSDVRYVRLKFTKGSGFVPKLGEVYISRRVQLEYKSQQPHDPKNLKSAVSIFESDSGVNTTYVFNKKRREFKEKFLIDTAARISDFEDFWEDDIDGGTQPYLWIEDPATSPHDAYWLFEKTPQLSGNNKVATLREFSINALEKGPNYLALGV